LPILLLVLARYLPRLQPLLSSTLQLPRLQPLLSSTLQLTRFLQLVCFPLVLPLMLLVPPLVLCHLR
jgi:hypothetical protein